MLRCVRVSVLKTNESPPSVSCLLSQKEMDKTKGQRDYEEKLIVSAWYNMVSGHELGFID